MNIIEFDQVCKDCKGSGLYVGMAENDGFAVVCHTCDGTGCVHVRFEYESFRKRKIKRNIIRVLQWNAGYCVGVHGSNGKIFPIDHFGGMSYKDWISGNPFPRGSEMRNQTCPCHWYQCVDYELKPDWCREENFWSGAFSSCPKFPEKEDCWIRFDKKQDRKFLGNQNENGSVDLG